MPKKLATSEIEVKDHKNRVLMIDLENCPNQIHQLMNDLEQYSQVVVCYAQSGSKVPLEWVKPLASIIQEDRLIIVKMPNGGKNSADFGITFWAGLLMAQSAPDMHFDIVSDDADLDHVVSLLINQKRSAERIRTKKDNDPKVPTLTNSVTAAQEYCKHLVTHNKNRPVKKETLINSIKSKFNDSGVNAEELFKELGERGAIVLQNNKINYHQEKITQLANCHHEKI
jgi:tRNA splicing endonuclease